MIPVYGSGNLHASDGTDFSGLKKVLSNLNSVKMYELPGWNIYK